MNIRCGLFFSYWTHSVVTVIDQHVRHTDKQGRSQLSVAIKGVWYSTVCVATTICEINQKRQSFIKLLKKTVFQWSTRHTYSFFLCPQKSFSPTSFPKMFKILQRKILSPRKHYATVFFKKKGMNVTVWCVWKQFLFHPPSGICLLQDLN